MSNPSAPAFRPTFRRGGDAAKQAAAEPLPGMPEPRRGEPKPMPSGRRANRYPGKCIRCQGWTPAEAGMLAKDDGGNWAVEHIECPSMAMEAAALDNLPKEGDAVMAQTYVGGKVLFDGDYTVDTPEGHRTLRLRTQSIEDDFMPGKQILSFLSGPDNESDYTRFGHLLSDGKPRVWRRFQDNTDLVRDLALFLADPHGDNGTVVVSVRCYSCGRKLTVPASVHNGLGSDCAKRFG